MLKHCPTACFKNLCNLHILQLHFLNVDAIPEREKKYQTAAKINNLFNEEQEHF